MGIERLGPAGYDPMMKSLKPKLKKSPAPSRNGHVAPSVPDVLTPEEAAAFFRVPVATVVAEAEAGRLPGRRLSGEWRFSQNVISNWLNFTKTAQGRPPAGIANDWDEDPEEFLRRCKSI